MTAQLTDAVEYIQSADEGGLDRIYAACKLRQKALKELRASSIFVGAEATTINLSPKYLNGLKGKVVSINRERGNLHITDEGSMFQISGTKYGPQFGEKEFTLRGIPLSCFKTNE